MNQLYYHIYKKQVVGLSRKALRYHLIRNCQDIWLSSCFASHVPPRHWDSIADSRILSYFKSQLQGKDDSKSVAYLEQINKVGK